MSRELQIRTTTYKGHTLTLRREGRGVAVTIRRGRKHCLTVRSERGDLEGACGAALDAVTARHNGQAWSALSNYTGPRGRLERRL